MLATNRGRRESMYLDMDVLTESDPPSRVPSPPNAAQGHADINGSAIADEEEPQPKKAGNLMKDIKQDVQQGAAEFNMDSFF